MKVFLLGAFQTNHKRPWNTTVIIAFFLERFPQVAVKLRNSLTQLKWVHRIPRHFKIYSLAVIATRHPISKWSTISWALSHREHRVESTLMPLPGRLTVTRIIPNDVIHPKQWFFKGITFKQLVIVPFEEPEMESIFLCNTLNEYLPSGVKLNKNRFVRDRHWLPTTSVISYPDHSNSWPP